MHRTSLILPKTLAAKVKLAAFQKGKSFSKFVAEILEDYIGEPESLLKKFEKEANSKTDGHLTIFKFTSEWKACLGTPNLDTGEGREQVRKLKGCKTLAEAIKWAIDNQVEPY